MLDSVEIRQEGRPRPSIRPGWPGWRFHRLTVHSLRHSHIMHHIHVRELPLPIVQKQVGHRTLKATSAYLKPSDEAVAEAYESALPSYAQSRG